MKGSRWQKKYKREIWKKKKKLLRLNPKIKLWYNIWKKAFAWSLRNLQYKKENWKIQFPFYFMSSNLVFFFSKYREFGRFGKLASLWFFFSWLRFYRMNYWFKKIFLWKKKFLWKYWYKKHKIENKYFTNVVLKKKFLNLKWLNNFIFWKLYIDFSYKWLIWRFSKKLNSIFLLNQKALNFLNRRRFKPADLIKGFLFVWCTWNNSKLRVFHNVKTWFSVQSDSILKVLFTAKIFSENICY